ncbi:MAG: hypothetical protein IIA83_07400 [Thaumarchaeota archaeon]|nr:hypothetical protein [Nitrososphaerota archaeon]
MKHKITMSLEVDIIKWIDAQTETGRFRNRSHGFEQCARIIKDRKIV